MKKIGLLLMCIVFLTACGNFTNDEASQNNNDNTVVNEISKDNKIYTTIYPVQFITEELVGDYVTVMSVVPNNGDIHNFDIPQKTIIDIAESDMYIYLGLDVEFNAEDIGRSLENENVTVLEVGEKIDFESGHDHEDEDEDVHDEEDDDHDHSDSHIWIDPLYVVDMAEVVKDALLIQYPTLGDEINENFMTLKEDLHKLDEDYTTQLANTDLDTFVVSHDKFIHLETYGIKSIAVKSEAHSKDPSAKEVEAIINSINELGIEKVVFENNVPCIPLERIKSETGADKVILSSLGSRMTSEVEAGLDYIDIMYNNLEVLTDILNIQK